MNKLPPYLQHEAAFRGSDRIVVRSDCKLRIMGVGALGSWLTDVLVRQGYDNLTVIDKDRVEPANYGTQNYGKLDVPQMKVRALRGHIHYRLGKLIEMNDREVTEKNVDRLIRGADLVVDLFDNAPSRNLLRDACARARVNCLHAGMSHDGFVQIEWNEQYEAHEPPAELQGPCDYPLAANLVHLAVALTAEAINRFVDDGVRIAVHATLRDLNVRTYQR